MLDHIDTWIFDLDNTLYPERCDLFSQVEQRIGRFIADTLSLSSDEAYRLQKHYFRTYGTSMRGMMAEHGTDPHAFLDFVHDIDYSPVAADDALRQALLDVGGRRVVFTNGSAGHAQAVLARLGITDLFDGIVDIVAAGFHPKPQRPGYDHLITAYMVDPRRAVMVEDIAANLTTAHAMGMTTVWIATRHAWAAPAADADFVDHRVEDLTAWLQAVAAAQARS